MSQTIKWDYYAAPCEFKVTKKAGLLRGRREGYWTLELGKVYSLEEGLSYMGQLGYELVGIQPTALAGGGQVQVWYTPSFYYIFKRSSGMQGDTA